MATKGNKMRSRLLEDPFIGEAVCGNNEEAGFVMIMTLGEKTVCKDVGCSEDELGECEMGGRRGDKFLGSGGHALLVVGGRIAEELAKERGLPKLTLHFTPSNSTLLCVCPLA